MADPANQALVGNLPRHAPRWLAPVLVSCSAIAIFSAPLLHPSVPVMTWFQDDLFYYVKTAANLAAGRGSTFDGLHRTNGYHPFYFLLISLVSVINPDLRVLLVCLSALAALAALMSFFAMRTVLTRCVPLPGACLDAVAILALIPCLNTFYLGMETTLTLPLGFLLLAVWLRTLTEPRPHLAAVTGTLAALLILSRLDSSFLIGLLLVSTLLYRREIPSLTQSTIVAFLAAFSLCLAPYFLVNKVLFGVWLPISGMAKQLRWHHNPSAAAWRSVLHPSSSQLLLLVLSLAAIPLFLFFSSQLSPAARAILAAAIGFRWLQFTALSSVSDWPLWGWYFYSVRFAVFSALLLAALAISRTRFAPLSATACRAWLTLAFVLLATQRWKRDPGSAEIYRTAVRLAAFSSAHPGLLAMGDRAGMVGYLAPAGVLQTEGLVMDHVFLDHIRRQDDLVKTLQAYGVRYYVASLEQPVYSGSCLLVAEPALAGPDAPRMRSRLCGKPVLTISGEHTTFVYDLSARP